MNKQKFIDELKKVVKELEQHKRNEMEELILIINEDKTEMEFVWFKEEE